MRKAPFVSALLLAAVFLGQRATAQMPLSAQAVVDRLFAYAADYRAKLPSLECNESITSERGKNGKSPWTVRMEFVFRVTPDSAHPGEFREERLIRSVDGRPPKTRWKVPYLVNNGFANAMGFAAPGHDNCYDYGLTAQDGGSRLRLEISAKRDLSAPACREVYPSYHKGVLIETQPFRILRVERQISAEDARKNKEPFFYAMDYGEQNFGQQKLWLPVDATSHDDEKSQGRLEIHFSNYHRFAAEIRVLPGSTPVEEAPK